MDIARRLQVLGLNESETHVYLSLVETEAATVSALARRVQMPRTTVHSILENLRAKGVVEVQREKGAARFAASDPKRLFDLVKREQARLLEKEQVAQELVLLLQPIFGAKRIPVPKVEVYEGREKLEAMLYAKLPEWEQSMIQNDAVLWGYQDPSFVRPYYRWLQHHWRRIEELCPNIEVRLFSDPKVDHESLPDGGPKNVRRSILPFPEPLRFSSSVWLMGDFVVLIQSNDDPHYAIQVQNPSLASNLKAFVKILWDTVSPAAATNDGIS